MLLPVLCVNNKIILPCENMDESWLAIISQFSGFSVTLINTRIPFFSFHVLEKC